MLLQGCTYLQLLCTSVSRLRLHIFSQHYTFVLHRHCQFWCTAPARCCPRIEIRSRSALNRTEKDRSTRQCFRLIFRRPTGETRDAREREREREGEGEGEGGESARALARVRGVYGRRRGQRGSNSKCIKATDLHVAHKPRIYSTMLVEPTSFRNLHCLNKSRALHGWFGRQTKLPSMREKHEVP